MGTFLFETFWGAEQKLSHWGHFFLRHFGDKVSDDLRSEQAMMSEDEKMQRLADLREKAILEEKTIENMGYKKGKEERIA